MVSVIIPVFNRAIMIKDTLNSLLAQTYQDWECILIDDGSTDNIDDVLKKYIENDNRFQFYKRPSKNLKGPSSCRNIGLEKAKGEYVIFLDSDDILAPFCLKERVKAFDKYKDFDFLVFYMKMFSKEIPFTESRDLNKRIEQNWLLNFLELRGSWQTSAPIYRLNFIKEIGGFVEGLNHYEDFVIATKVINYSSKFKVFDNVDYYYRNDENYQKKHKNLNYNNKSVHAFLKLIDIYNINLLEKESSIAKVKLMKKSIVKGYFSIFKEYIINNIEFYKEVNIEIVELLHKNKYITTGKYNRFVLAEDILYKFRRLKKYGLHKVVILLMR